MGRAKAGVAKPTAFNFEFDKGISNDGSRGKSLVGDLGNGPAYFKVFFFEESLCLPKVQKIKINGINEMGGCFGRRGNSSSKDCMARRGVVPQQSRRGEWVDNAEMA